MVRGRGAENIEGKIKTDGRKTLINEDEENEECKESQITTMSTFGFTFYIKNSILLKNVVVKGKKVKSSLCTFHLQFFSVAGYLKRCNDTPKLNIHKYNNYNIIEIYINRLSLTMQIFIAMNYLMLEK